MKTGRKKGSVPWNKGIHTGIKPWLGKKHPGGGRKPGTVASNIDRVGLACAHCKEVFTVNRYKAEVQGAKYCSRKCYQSIAITEETREKRRKASALRKDKSTEFYRIMGIKGVLAQKQKETSLERKVYRVLEDSGLVFEKQKLINGKFLVDAFVPSLNLVIEADGAYWHSLERVVKKDKAENAYLAKCGYKVLRIPEDKVSEFSTAALLTEVNF